MNDLDEILGSPEAEEADELKPPRRLKTPANILAAMRWTARQQLAGKISGEKGLAAMRSLQLLLAAIKQEEPDDDEGETWDVKRLAQQRRKQAAQLKEFCEERGLSEVPERTEEETAEMLAKLPRVNQRQTLNRGAEEEPFEEIRERLEMAEDGPTDPIETAEAILRDNPGTREEKWNF